MFKKSAGFIKGFRKGDNRPLLMESVMMDDGIHFLEEPPVPPSASSPQQRNSPQRTHSSPLHSMRKTMTPRRKTTAVDDNVQSHIGEITVTSPTAASNKPSTPAATPKQSKTPRRRERRSIRRGRKKNQSAAAVEEDNAPPPSHTIQRVNSSDLAKSFAQFNICTPTFETMDGGETVDEDVLQFAPATTSEEDDDEDEESQEKTFAERAKMEQSIMDIVPTAALSDFRAALEACMEAEDDDSEEEEEELDHVQEKEEKEESSHHRRKRHHPHHKHHHHSKRKSSSSRTSRQSSLAIGGEMTTGMSSAVREVLGMAGTNERPRLATSASDRHLKEPKRRSSRRKSTAPRHKTAVVEEETTWVRSPITSSPVRSSPVKSEEHRKRRSRPPTTPRLSRSAPNKTIQQAPSSPEKLSASPPTSIASMIQANPSDRMKQRLKDLETTAAVEFQYDEQHNQASFGKELNLDQLHNSFREDKHRALLEGSDLASVQLVMNTVPFMDISASKDLAISDEEKPPERPKEEKSKPPPKKVREDYDKLRFQLMESKLRMQKANEEVMRLEQEVNQLEDRLQTLEG